MDDFVELGLARPDAPVALAVPPELDSEASHPMAALVERLLILLADSAPDAGADATDAFQTRLDEYRHELKHAASRKDQSATVEACVRTCETYFRTARQFSADREAELQEVIRMLQEAAALMSGNSARFHAELMSQSERVRGLVQLEDIRELKRRLTTEVTSLRQAVEEKQKKDEAEAQVLSQRLETLQSRLARAEEEASTDGLTRVANRASFDRVLRKMMAAAQEARSPLTLAMIDIDNFKAINDAHGHPIGDRVLLCTAMWISKGLRHTDFIARYGGEEFAVIMSDTRLTIVEARLAQVLSDIASRSFEYEAGPDVKTVRFTVSCGVTELGPGETPEDLIRRADEALYDAKRKGKNRVIARRRSRFGGLLSLS